MEEQDILNEIDNSRAVRLSGDAYTTKINGKGTSEITYSPRYDTVSDAFMGIGSTVASGVAGATSATLGLPTDIAGLFVGIKDAVSAEDGQRIDAFVNGFTEFSKANLGSEYYRGIFNNFVDGLDVDPKLKEDAKSGFSVGEFGGVGGAVTKGPKVIKKGLEKVGDKAQRELDLDTGAMMDEGVADES